MTGSTNSISTQLEQALTLQENAVRIANAFKEAIVSSKTSVSVELVSLTNETFTIDIPTNINLGTRLDSLSKTVENLIGLSKDGRSRLISKPDSTISELIVKSNDLTENQKLTTDDFTVSSEIAINNNAIIENLLSPLPTLEITIPNEFDTTSYLVEKYSFDAATNFSNGVQVKDLKKYLSANKLSYKKVDNIVQINPRIKRYTGSFVVESSSIVDGLLTVIIDKTTYNDSYSIVDDSKYLQVGDILSKNDKSVKYKITRINDKNLVLQLLSGIGSIVKDNILTFVETNDSVTDVTISIPVKLNEKSIIFLTPINNTNNQTGLISDGIVFDSTNYYVTSNFNEIPFNEYFYKNISNISSYFTSLLSENVIPVSLAIVPDVPILEESNFKILQINKHLTNSAISDKLEKLQKEKSITENQLDVISSTISTLNSKINSGNYASTSKRDSDKALLAAKIQERDEKSILLSSIVSNISATVATSDTDTFAPKYRLRGFWKIADDMVSEETRDQKIIQYEIRYRYTTLKSNTTSSEQFIYTDGDQSITAIISPWAYQLSAQLNRVVNDDKSVDWVPNDENSIEYSNINQLDIPITYGEAIEFQIRAISEAGWPTSSVKSDWSKVVRREFGDDTIKTNNTLSIIEQNKQDVLRVQVENEFRSQGYTAHIANAYTEQEKYFAHGLDDISSGKRTTDQKTISALAYIESLENRISVLNEIVNKRYASVSVQLVDSDSLLTYDVANFSKISLFAGNYIDNVDLSVSENFGTIVTKKFYLKLTNQNTQTIEMLSIAPGGLQQNVSSNKYTNIPLLINTLGFSAQRKGQLFYNRLQNVDLTQTLYASDVKTESTIPSGDIDTSASLTERTVVHKSLGGVYEAVKLSSSANLNSYVAMTVNHPAYVRYKSTGQVDEMNEIFDRIENFNKLMKDNYQQSLFENTNINSFEVDDKYLIGENTIGSALYVALNDFSSYQVDGVDSSASKEIYSGEQDSILIPIIFQYRMTDALGNVNGLTSLTANSNFEFSKTIGFDLFINNKLFSFDVEVHAKYRPSTTANQRLNIVPTTDNIRAKIN